MSIEERRLGEVLGLDAPVRSDNLRVVDVSVNQVNKEMIDAGVAAAQKYWLVNKSGYRITSDLVLCILQAALGQMHRGQQEDRHSTPR